MQDKIWVTRDHKAILVSQMTTSHIMNAIALIRRRYPWRAEYLDRLELELVIRAIKNAG